MASSKGHAADGLQARASAAIWARRAPMVGPRRENIIARDDDVPAGVISTARCEFLSAGDRQGTQFMKADTMRKNASLSGSIASYP
ncbi:MAG: hypothetical protein RJA63_2629 [Pseudomonadota bacterium]|jgi:hypothetical protein